MSRPARIGRRTSVAALVGLVALAPSPALADKVSDAMAECQGRAEGDACAVAGRAGACISRSLERANGMSKRWIECAPGKAPKRAAKVRKIDSAGPTAVLPAAGAIVAAVGEDSAGEGPRDGGAGVDVGGADEVGGADDAEAAEERAEAEEPALAVAEAAQAKLRQRVSASRALASRALAGGEPGGCQISDGAGPGLLVVAFAFGRGPLARRRRGLTAG